MPVNGCLISPDVNQQNRFRVVHGKEIGISPVSALLTDQTGGPAALHLFRELAGVASLSGVIQIHDNAHSAPPSRWDCRSAGSLSYRRSSLDFVWDKFIVKASQSDESREIF